MDQNKLKQSLAFVAKHEWEGKPNGGYTNDPNDPGGETKYGISKRAHPNEDIRNLTPDRALAIYCSDYWVPIGGDNIPLPTCVVVFDSAVNHGVHRTMGWFMDTKDDWKALINVRKQFYLAAVKNKPTDQKFLNGWLNRLADLQKYCENFISND